MCTSISENAVRAYYISITTDGQHFSNEALYVVYDVTCLDCDVTGNCSVTVGGRKKKKSLVRFKKCFLSSFFFLILSFCLSFFLSLFLFFFLTFFLILVHRTRHYFYIGTKMKYNTHLSPHK